ncbi:hypothetical protein PAXINDRAFT_173467 [Paxillus involutus ATCC 200175]|uniref:Protein kinase domain-containing protein n=1 Tax=Paxillus involutus ATCC 200175 TaxID=664439 RepID=A0A0C9TJG3_PAXIN|nr:hypothetical protein PAXINDRAFT_173467 [Paxillus involutus ATCC 200175]
MPRFLEKRKELAAQRAAQEEERKQLLLQLRLETFGRIRTQPDELGEGEEWWRDLYQWLYDAGYQLRSRYHPEWVASWKTRSLNWMDCEDSVVRLTHLMDATRLSDGRSVAIKRLEISMHPHEVAIAQYLWNEELRRDPTNYTVPIFDVLHPPDDADCALLVMPMLLRCDEHPFETIGEMVEFLRQVFEGLQFMHKKHVAHRDCMRLNIMMDGEILYDEPFHPLRPKQKRDLTGFASRRTRTERPPKYLFIDFGISRRYDASTKDPLEDPIWGGDKTVPEFQHSDEPRNPFPTDVYYLGNMIREDFMTGKVGFDFMAGLVNDMVQNDPSKRPTVDEVVARFVCIRTGLSHSKLRSRVVSKYESRFDALFRGVVHWTRRIGFVMRRIPPTPVL